MQLEQELQQRFGYATFRIGQKEIITGILKGQHVIGRLPTGSGKSLCYFFLAPYIEGLFIVISPLVALMEDQVYRLKMEGMKNVAALNGLRTPEERQEIFSSLRQIKYLFLSPEMLQNRYIQAQLRKVRIGLFVVDEAHCISKWGYDFRSDYLRIRDFFASYPDVRVLALTATATQTVLKDIQVQLGLPRAGLVLSQMNRKNISILVEKLESLDLKYERLFEILQNVSKPVLIYCNRRKMTEELYEKIRRLSAFQSVQMAYFHGGLDAKSKMSLTEQFVTGYLDMMICTNAFGMGLHKEDIHTVIHFEPPFQVESYMQEMGRAGRDGKPACSIVLWTEEDFYQNQTLLLSEGIEKNEIQTYLYLKYIKGTSDSLQNHKLIEYYLDTVFDAFGTNHAMKKRKEFIEKNLDFYTEKIYNYIIERKQFHIEECMYMESFFRNESVCRREKLLRYFDEDISGKHKHCCDICGDRISNHESIGFSKAAFVTADWLEKLQALLL